MFEHKGNLELWLDTSISCNPSAREHYSCFRTTLDNPSPVLSRFDTSRWKTQKMLMLQTTKQTTKNDIDRPSFYFCLISRPCSSQLAPRMIVPLTARNGIGRWHPLIQIRLFSRQSHFELNKHVVIQDAGSDTVFACFGHSNFSSQILPKHEQVAKVR